MYPKYQLSAFLFLFILLSACSKEKKEVVQPQILEFKLETSLNSSLITKDLLATIDANTISFSIPEGIQLKNVTPSFNTNTDGITYNNSFITTKKSLISIADNDVIKIKINNLEKSYTVKINTYADSDLNFSSFMIEKSKNPILNNDIIFSKNENSDTLFASINNMDDNLPLTPSFSTGAASVIYNNNQISSGAASIQFTSPVSFLLISKSGFKKEISVQLKYVTAAIPHIYITTVNNTPVSSKDNYVDAGININGFGSYADYKDSTKIRGRGNSTWSLPKKPYRLKLYNKAPLFGLSTEKDWVLLANYIDPTLLLNATALKMGELLDAPFTNHTVQVELTINGVYQGLYTFTEQVEVESNRVNVKDGAMLELDSYFDEDFKFRSVPYDLPVNIKYPDLTSNAEIEPIKNQFNSALSLLNNVAFPNNNYLNYFDSTSYVNYILTYWLTDNRELNHPKSSYIHLKKDGKYYFGPIWDFDWAYGYETDGKHFITYNASFFNSRPISKGTVFFKKFLDDPKIKAKIKRRWAEFRATMFTQLSSYVTQQGILIKDAYNRNNTKWQKSGSSTSTADAQRIVTWLTNRANYLDTYIQSL